MRRFLSIAIANCLALGSVLNLGAGPVYDEELGSFGNIYAYGVYRPLITDAGENAEDLISSSLFEEIAAVLSNLGYLIDFDLDGIVDIQDLFPKFNESLFSLSPDGLTILGIDPAHVGDIILPDTITHIADQAFADLDSLISIELPDSLQNIGAGAFQNASNLEQIIFNAIQAPNIGQDAFLGVAADALRYPANGWGYGDDGDLLAGLPVNSEELEEFIQGDFVRGILARLTSGEGLSAIAQGELETFSRLVAGFLVKVAKDYDIPESVINPGMLGELSMDFLPDLAEEYGPMLATIRQDLQDLDEIVQLLRDNLQEGQDALQEMKAYLTLSQELVDEVFGAWDVSYAADLKAQFDIWQELYIGHFETPDFEAEFTAYFEQIIFDLSMEFTLPGIQLALRQRVQDMRAAIQTRIDSLLASIEQAIRQEITDLVAGLDLGEIDTSFLSPLDEVCAAGEINGHAQILGDRLDLLRIDAKFEMKAPDELGFAGYLEIKCLNSQGNGGCVYEGAEFHEFTIGALDVPVAFLGGDVGMNIETAFTFADDAFPLRGLAGKIEMSRGTLEFETFKILDLGAAVAFGEFENYLACAAALQLNQYRVAGGLFFGRTCTIDPLAIAHEQTAELLWSDGGGAFTGALVYGFASIPISEALGIPASCMFYVSAGFGGGVFFSVDGPTFGGIMKLDVGGEALCAVGINGNVSLVGIKTGNDFRFSGTGYLGGKVGKCPFCLKFGKSVGIQYASEQWKLSL
jgi:hypothetical protein